MDHYVVSSDPRHLDLDAIHRFLSQEAYWSRGVTRQVVERAIRNSLVFGAYLGEPGTIGARQVGFCRVVTDKATFAWLCDVFVLPEHRGKGLAERMLEAVLAHPDLRGLRNFVLATRDAHGLYEKYGFARLSAPGSWMRRREGRLG